MFISDICSYGMLSAIDRKSKAMYLVYGEEVFPPVWTTRVHERNRANTSHTSGQLQEQVDGQNPEEHDGAR